MMELTSLLFLLLPSFFPFVCHVPRLGGAKDTERLLALFEAMVPLMGIEHTAR